MFNKSILISAILIGLILLAGGYNTIAQTSKYYEAPRAMIYRLQQEIDEMQAKIAEDPSSPDAERLKIMIQLNNRKIKEILPGATEQIIRGIKPNGKRLEDYMVIAQNNLFTPLGAVAEVKQQQFFVTGIMGMGTRNVAFIQSNEGNSYYVAEGDTFGNGIRVASITPNRVNIINAGNRIDLKLGEGSPDQQPPRERVGGVEFSRKSPGGTGKSDNGGPANLAETLEQRKFENREWEREEINLKIGALSQKREEIKRIIAEMEKRGQKDPDAYRKIEEIDRNIGMLKSELP